MDYSILNWINTTFGNSKFFAIVARILSFIGGKWGMISLVLLLLCFKKTRKVGFYVMIAGGVTFIFNDFIIKMIIKRDRPFVTYPELENMCKLAGEEFPDGFSMASGHAATSMAVAVAIMFFSKKWGGVAIGTSVLIGLSRLMLCVHFPTDVLTGWILGAALSVGLHYLTNIDLKFIISKGEKKNEKDSTSIKEQPQD